MKRPRIKRTTEFVDLDQEDLLLFRPSLESHATIIAPSDRDRELLAALDGGHSLQQLNEMFGESAVGDAIAQLEMLGAIEDGADDDLVDAAELARFDRQLRYFSDMRQSDGPTPSECQQRLRDACVVVIGVGGVGGAAALALATVGIGNICLIDGDRVELSNFNRQILYDVSDIGQLKVEMAAARLRAFNPAINISTAARMLESQDAIAEAIDGADVVVDAADWPAHDIEDWCNSACFDMGIPFITMSHFPPLARVGPFFVPGQTGCYRCLETALRRETPLLDAIIDQRRARSAPAATLGPPCLQIGGQVGTEVMHLLTGLYEPSTLGVAHVFDLRTMQMRKEPVVPELGCSVCGGMLEDHRARDHSIACEDLE